MKRLLLPLATILLMAVLFLPGTLQAQLDSCADNNPDTPCNVLNPVCATNPEAVVCQENKNPQDPGNNTIYGPDGIITKAARLIALIVGVASVIMIIVGGIRYVIASGDVTNTTNAKNAILYAIIGLIVASLAQAIVIFVLNKL